MGKMISNQTYLVDKTSVHVLNDGLEESIERPYQHSMLKKAFSYLYKLSQ